MKSRTFCSRKPWTRHYLHRGSNFHPGHPGCLCRSFPTPSPPVQPNNTARISREQIRGKAQLQQGLRVVWRSAGCVRHLTLGVTRLKINERLSCFFECNRTSHSSSTDSFLNKSRIPPGSLGRFLHLCAWLRSGSILRGRSHYLWCQVHPFSKR